MNTIKNAYEECTHMMNTGELNGLTLHEVNCIWDILRDIYHGKVSETITGKVATWFSERGFSVATKGIGWAIST